MQQSRLSHDFLFLPCFDGTFHSYKTTLFQAVSSYWSRMEVLLHDPVLFIAVYTPQRGLFDIEYEGDLTDFSIESNLASPPRP